MKNILKNILKKSWFAPDAIERNSIIDALKNTRNYARGRMLDIGCGDKPYKPIFSDVLEEYIGIDREDSKLHTISPDVYGDFLSLPFENESFDTVLSTQVLDDIHDPDKAMVESFRVLKKGGHFILTSPFFWPIHDEPFDYCRYTKYGLKNLAEKSGFKVVFLKERGYFWAVLGEITSQYLFYDVSKYPKYKILSAFFIPFIALIQIICSVIDKLHKVDKYTLGYVMVCLKE